MSVKTTLYVHENTLELIHDACAITGKKRTEVIVMLLTRSLREASRDVTIGKSVRYQARDRAGRWRTIHVSFREDEADYCKDLRNFLKRSDSLILALAARAYLRGCIKKSCFDGWGDNYRFSNYIISREESEGLIFWKICWGFPKNPEAHFRL